MCKYCDDEESIIIQGKKEKIFGEDFPVDIWISCSNPRRLLVHVRDKEMISLKIKYCYMCGRKLE